MVGFLQVALFLTLICVSTEASLYYGDAIVPAIDDDDNSEPIDVKNVVEEGNSGPEVSYYDLDDRIFLDKNNAGIQAIRPSSRLSFNTGQQTNRFSSRRPCLGWIVCVKICRPHFSSFDKNEHFNSTLGAIKNSTFYVIDPTTGKVESEHGADMFYMPHGITVDKKGNIWVTDVGSHQVMKKKVCETL